MRLFTAERRRCISNKHGYLRLTHETVIMRIRLSFLILCSFFFFVANAQVQFNGWLASFNTFSLGKKLSLHLEGQLRSTDQVKGVQTVLLRTGLNVHLSKKLMLTGGYAFVDSRRTAGNLSSLLPEHRIWQQATANHKIKTVAVTHRLRFEERFLAKAAVVNNEIRTDGFNQAFRFRYFLRNLIPFTAKADFKRGWYAAVQDEVFLNTGTKTAVNGKTFDQNRLYGAVGYRLSAKIDAETGYMNQYISTATGSTNNHIVQVAVYKRL